MTAVAESSDARLARVAGLATEGELAAAIARIATLEAIVGRQAASLARLEMAHAAAAPVDRLRGLGPSKRLLLGCIIDRVAASFHVAADELLGRSREGYIIQSRFAAVWLYVRLSGVSMARAAGIFGYRDHTGIAHAMERAEGWRRLDPDFAAVTDRLYEQLRAEIAEARP